MTPPAIQFELTDLDALADVTGQIAVLVTPEGKLDPGARRLNRLTRGAVARYVESAAFEALSEGAVGELAWPSGLAASAILVGKLERRTTQETARKLGAALALKLGEDPLLVLAGNAPRAADLAFGLALRAYRFETYKSDPAKPYGALRIMHTKPDEVAAQAAPGAALAEGIYFTRDLVNEPANTLTTQDFAARLEAMQELGLEVEILNEDQLAELGMGALLAVGQGSESPSKVAVMQWKGAGDDTPPLALVGKGVVFDTGGISLKPALGMEGMTADMGGAGVVSGVMRTLALRQAKANVVGLVGLVENMPDGRATRPGDIVKTMKGDTVEVVNTDAEGRLVLADVLWYAQERFAPAAVIDLATLTGAIIISLGHDLAGVFSNDDDLAQGFLNAAAAEGEGAWRMPLSRPCAKSIKSRLADVKNSGGRPGGSITAALFLERFIQDDMPWIHLDIAGVTDPNTAPDLAPKGASGWGVLALDRLIRDRFEG